MRKIIFAIPLLLLALGGCAQLTALTSSTVSTESVGIAVNGFDALEATATNYLRLRRCTGTNGPVCRDPAATAEIIPAVRAGRVARNNIEQFLKDHPGQLGTTGLYDALTAASSTLGAIITKYKAGTA